MTVIALLPALAAAALQPAAKFAPPLDTPVRYTISETRTNGATPHTYVLTRSVVFRRDGTGFRADVTTLSARAEPVDEKGRMFLAANRTFIRRTLRFRLGADGGVIEVIDRQREWDGWLDRVSAAWKRDHARAFVRIERFVANLRRASPERQVETLGEHVARVVGADVVARGPTPPTPVRIPTETPAAPTELAGTERIVRRPGGLLHHERSASGAVGQGGTMRSVRSRDVDPASGLVRQARDTITIDLSGRTLTSDRMMTVTLPVF